MSEAATMNFTVTPLSDALGAEVTGLDLAVEHDDATIQAVLDAWHEHLVLVFRDQDLTQEDQVRFTERFGTTGFPKQGGNRNEGPDVHRAIMLVTNIREDGKPIGMIHDGEMWFHADMCYAEVPHKATLLYAVELPKSGGNTRFANLHAAYDRLSDDVKQRIAGRTALQMHDYKRLERPDPDRIGEVAHYSQPIVVRHPATGRPALYVNRLMTACVDGMDRAESNDLLDELLAASEDPSLVYEHVWRPGDLVMWDNRCTIHARTDYPGTERRLLRRTTVVGEKLEHFAG